MTDDTDGFVTVISKREEEPLIISGVMYLIIGLVSTSVLFIILYLCAHVLENANCKDPCFDILIWLKVPVASSLESFPVLFVMRRFHTDLFITHLVWRIELTLYKVPLKDLPNHVGSGFFPSIETPQCMNICISYIIYTRVMNSILLSYSIWLVCKSVKVYITFWILIF